MEDDEQEELRCTGSDVEIEEYTDTEEPHTTYQASEKSHTWQKFIFIFTLIVVIISITVIVITFPLYLESVSTVSNGYSGKKLLKNFISFHIIIIIIIIILLLLLYCYLYLCDISALLFTAFGSVCILAVVCFVKERVSPSPIPIPCSNRIDIPRNVLLKISLLYATSGILIGLSLDQNRVLCHLQDPIKGIILVFSLIYYFFFCRKSKSIILSNICFIRSLISSRVAVICLYNLLIYSDESSAYIF